MCKFHKHKLLISHRNESRNDKKIINGIILGFLGRTLLAPKVDKRSIGDPKAYLGSIKKTNKKKRWPKTLFFPFKFH